MIISSCFSNCSRVVLRWSVRSAVGASSCPLGDSACIRYTGRGAGGVGICLGRTQKAGAGFVYRCRSSCFIFVTSIIPRMKTAAQCCCQGIVNALLHKICDFAETSLAGFPSTVRLRAAARFRGRTAMRHAGQRVFAAHMSRQIHI